MRPTSVWLLVFQTILISGCFATGFVCPEENGFFPDLKGCTSYYACSNNTASFYTCNGINVYKPGTNTCVLRAGLDKCFKFNCLRKNEKSTVYPGDLTLYAACRNNKAISISKCARYLTFNERNQRCEVQCLKEGKMVDPSSNKTFIECIRTGVKGEFQMMYRTCPLDTFFDPARDRCEEERETTTTETVVTPTDLPSTPGTESSTPGIPPTGTDPADISSPDPDTRTTPNPDPPSKCNDGDTTCANCTTVEICIGNENFAFECGENQYCNATTGVCVMGDITECQHPPPESFFCPSAGYFPDPINCNFYHLCLPSEDQENNFVHFLSKCDSDSHFDPKTSTCSAIECSNFVCESNSLSYSTHPLDKSFYTFCINREPTFVKKCSPGEYFNTTQKACTVLCKTKEQIAILNDCFNFLDCRSAGEDPVVIKCGQLLWFDPEKKRCDLLSQEQAEKCSQRS